MNTIEDKEIVNYLQKHVTKVENHFKNSPNKVVWKLNVYSIEKLFPRHLHELFNCFTDKELSSIFNNCSYFPKLYHDFLHKILSYNIPVSAYPKSIKVDLLRYYSFLKFLNIQYQNDWVDIHFYFKYRQIFILHFEKTEKT